MAARSGSSSAACCSSPAWSASSGSAFGGAAIRLQQTGTDIAAAGGLESQLFSTLQAYPFANASVLVMVLVAIFFVSGADAASIVMGTLSERGTMEPSRPSCLLGRPWPPSRP